MINHKGECHCGKIRFMFKAPSITSLTICNCSICNALGFQHIFIPHKNFTLLSGENFLKSYRFGSGKAEHMFCTCFARNVELRHSTSPGHILINIV